MIERLATDRVEDLLRAYKDSRKREVGKSISDVALVFAQLTEWMTPEDAEAIIPYKFARKKRLPKGASIWSLSRHKTEIYYAGDFFDCIIQAEGKRITRLKCRLSAEAIKFFQTYPQVKENHDINL